jgi:hypothetical protein
MKNGNMKRLIKQLLSRFTVLVKTVNFLEKKWVNIKSQKVTKVIVYYTLFISEGNRLLI